MLPEDVIARYSLQEGAERPVVSLYVDIAEADGAIKARHSRLQC